MEHGQYAYVVDGERVRPNDEITVTDPATNTAIATVPEAGAEGTDEAIESSLAVESEWSDFDAVDRGQLLNDLADRIREESDRLAKIETADTGRPLIESTYMVEGAAGYFEYYAGLTDKIEGRQIPISGEDSYIDYTVREPYGVTAHVVPWNAALPLAARSFAPALAAGNTVVAKAPEKAPLSVIELTELAHDVGFPDGVLNTLTGRGSTTGDSLVSDPRVSAVEFTGSVETGKQVMRSAADRITEIHLELGGKGANIVFEDADLDAAVQSVVDTFQNAGQICYAPTRLFVQAGVYEEFVEHTVERVESMSVGPASETADMGPLITGDAQQTVSQYVEEARKQGARVLTGGEIPRDTGHFYAPTLIDQVSDDAPISCEEVFGPVITVHEFETTGHVVERANATNYGLSNLVWTSDLSTAHTVADGLESGTVMINDYPVLSPAAVSGGYKESGLGRAKGQQALNAFTQTKNVVISLD